MTVPAQFNFIDGGERAPGNLNYYAALGVTANGFGNFGGKSFFLSDDPQTSGFAPPNFSAATCYWTVRLYLLNWSSPPQYVALYNSAGTEQLKIQFNSDGSATLFSGNVQLSKTAQGIFQIQTIFQISIGAKIDPATGFVNVYLNGNPTPVPGLSVTSADTAQGDSSNLPITGLHVFVWSNSGYFRDISCHDGTGPAPLNGPLGDCGAELTMPNGNVSSALVPSTGTSNAAIYAATPPGSAYCGSSTVGAADTVTIAPLPANVLSVIGFKAFDYAAKSDTGSRAIQKTVTSGSTNAVGAENFLNETPVPTEDLYTTDPATGAAITVAAYNALKLTETVAA